jgi:hypothetical protein
LSAPILIPQIDFLTNDAWMLLTGITNGNGYPILLMDRYSKGILYVLTIPENFNDLYDFPPQALGAIRSVILGDFPVIADAPGQVSLFAYDNNSFIVESYLPTPQYVTLAVAGGFRHLRDLQTGGIFTGQPARFGGASTRPTGTFRGPPRVLFSIQLQPHSYEPLVAEK